jgi:two-component system, OmpR family, phosphate regulon response regulator PhoB
MARVLVIEDDPDHPGALEDNLVQAGHHAFAASTGKAGLKVAREVQPDVVLLDLVLPDMPGTSVAKELRRDPATQRIPIIMVTAKADEIDRVVGFEIGAADFVVKPFNVRELLLRIEAVLRRSSRPPHQEILNVGELRVDCQAHRVTVNAVEISLAALEFKLLVTLIERRDHVQARGTLLNDVWGVAPEVTTRTVDTHVKRLRDKLGSAGKFIQTVRGVGYRFSEDPGGQQGRRSNPRSPRL